jgi:hypothetical protein
MILPRVLTHLPHQDGNAIGIELVIVILGMFLGNNQQIREGLRVVKEEP